MSVYDFDPEILQDFLTESGELLEQLEGDLVDLESTPQDLELLNQVFRALHTIKGSASFLALTNLVAIAHCTESALNTARNGDLIIGKGEMDLLLAAVDVLKIQFDELNSGNMDLTAADEKLIKTLTFLGDGGSLDDAADDSQSQDSAPGIEDAAPAAQASYPDGRTITPILLDSSKLDLIEASGHRY